MTIGMAMPANALSTDATEFIGILVRYVSQFTQYPISSIVAARAYLTYTCIT